VARKIIRQLDPSELLPLGVNGHQPASASLHRCGVSPGRVGRSTAACATDVAPRLVDS